MDSTPHLTPELRALRAAEQIDAAGDRVTGAAVRERAGVAMATAVEAARTWNNRAAREAETARADGGAVPSSVRNRFQSMGEAIWRESVTAAREQHSHERQSWDDARARLEEQVAAQTATIEEIESDNRRLVDKLEIAKERYEQELASARSEVVEVRTQLETVRSHLDALRRELIETRSRADRAEAAFEAQRRGYEDLRAVISSVRAPTSEVETHE